MQKPILIIYGPVGSGKGTQAELLVKAFGIVHIAGGDILREQIATNSPSAKTIKEYIDRGELVPFDIVDELIRQRLENPDIENGMIFDGYPRALAQAKTLLKMLAMKNKTVTKVISIKLGVEDIIKRLSTRLICLNCRSIYNTVADPPKLAGICDKCGAKLIQRSDDQEAAAIHERMNVYREETLPVLEFFAEKGLVEEFDGAVSIEKLHDEIYKSLVML